MSAQIGEVTFIPHGRLLEMQLVMGEQQWQFLLNEKNVVKMVYELQRHLRALRGLPAEESDAPQGGA